jgi:glutathione S-transferase
MEDAMQKKVEKLVSVIESISPETVTIPTLVYFDIVGIAWPIRCLLHIKDIDYNYVPISIQEWAFRSADGHQPLKSAFSNGHVPFYVDKDIALNQSNLILTMLARRTGMMGDSDKEALAIESVLAHCYDALFHWNGMLTVNIRLNLPDDVAQARLNSFMGDGVWGLVANGFRNHLRGFVKLLEANPSRSGFMVGDRMSAADLSTFNVLCNWYKAFDREVFSEEFPSLDQYIHRIALMPGISDYIRNVQESTVWFELPTVALRLNSSQEMEGLVVMHAVEESSR